MTFKYALVLPVTGTNKISRVKAWARAHVPSVEINLPVQVPVDATALTVRLKSAADRDAVRTAFPKDLA